MEPILIGTTDRSILVWIADPASTDGGGKTGLTHADLTVSYTRVETDNDVVVTDVTSSLTTLSALTDAHADWGVKEVSSTLAPGLYRIDVADAVFASGAWYAVVQVTITTSLAAATPKAFQLVAYNPLDGVRLGLTALPNAAADAAGGLPISDAGGLDLDAQIGTKIDDILTDTGTTLQGELDGIQADTEDIQTRLPAALDGGYMAAKLANGVAHGGSTATLTLGTNGATAAFSVTNLGAGPAVKFDATNSGSGTAIQLFGGSAGMDVSGADYAIQLNSAGQVIFCLDSTLTNIEFVTLIQDIWAAAARTLTALDEDSTTLDIDAAVRAAVGLASANLDTQLDALPTALEIRNAITGGAYALDTDSNGRVRIVDGTGTGEINTTSGVVEARLANDVSHGGNNAQIWLQSTGLVSPLTIKCNNFGSGIGPAISLDVDAGECIRLYGGSALTTGVVFEVGSKAVSCTSTGVTSDVQGTWNAAWDAEVQSECEDALAAYGASTLTAAGIRTAVGLASANLDTQLDALPTAVENADALLARNAAGGSNGGKTVAFYVQGGLPKVVQNASGTSYTIYGADGTTVLSTGTIGRLATTVGGVEDVTPA